MDGSEDHQVNIRGLVDYTLPAVNTQTTTSAINSWQLDVNLNQHPGDGDSDSSTLDSDLTSLEDSDDESLNQQQANRAEQQSENQVQANRLEQHGENQVQANRPEQPGEESLRGITLGEEIIDQFGRVNKGVPVYKTVN